MARPPQEAVVWELLLRSLLIGRRKQWPVILSIVSVLFRVRVRHHWWLLFRAAGTRHRSGTRHFYFTVVQRRQRNDVHKAWCTCKVVVLLIQRFAFLLFPSVAGFLTNSGKISRYGIYAKWKATTGKTKSTNFISSSNAPSNNFVVEN